MKFALFFLGDYAAMTAGSAVVVTLFFGATNVDRTDAFARLGRPSRSA